MALARWASTANSSDRSARQRRHAGPASLDARQTGQVRGKITSFRAAAQLAADEIEPASERAGQRPRRDGFRSAKSAIPTADTKCLRRIPSVDPGSGGPSQGEVSAGVADADHEYHLSREMELTER